MPESCYKKLNPGPRLPANKDTSGKGSIFTITIYLHSLFWFISLRLCVLEQRAPSGYYKGIEEFNKRNFFECHEILEDIWNEEPTELRRLYQGILQIATAFHHVLVTKKYRGATRLLETGMEWLQPFLPETFKTDLAELVEASTLALIKLRELGPERLNEFELDSIPQIHFTDPD